jgi:hypothetical protein
MKQLFFGGSLVASELAEAWMVGYLSWMPTPRDPCFAGYRHRPELISYVAGLA